MSRQSVPFSGIPVCRSVGRLLPWALLALVAACSKPTAAADVAAGGGKRDGGPGVPVLTATAIRKDVPQLVQTVGTVEAYSTVDIRPQVSGTLLRISFAEGQDVNAGDLLFTIDPQPYQVALNQAQATLAKDAAQADNAEAMRGRSQDLLKRGILAPQDYDTSASTAAALKATVQADQAQIDNAKLQLQYTKITAPVSGRTGALLVHEGNLLRTTDTTSLVVINQVLPIRVVFGVPAAFLSSVRTGQAAAPLSTTARAAGSRDPVSHGIVSFLDNTVDPSTGTLKVKGTYPNTDRKLWPGELVEVSLQLSVATHATVVPAAAVQNGQQGQYVYIVNADHTVAFRPVEVALRTGDDVVVSTGIKVGEEVVTDGQLGLTPGSKIQIKNAGARGIRP
jgi:multidrug efflux system membrane fusion protein